MHPFCILCNNSWIEVLLIFSDFTNLPCNSYLATLLVFHLRHLDQMFMILSKYSFKMKQGRGRLKSCFCPQPLEDNLFDSACTTCIHVITSGNTCFFFSDLCWGKAMVAYTMPQQTKKEKSEMLRGERDQTKFINLGFERWQAIRFRKARGRQDVP